MQQDYFSSDENTEEKKGVQLRFSLVNR